VSVQVPVRTGSLRRYLAARMLPLAVLLAVLVSLSAPLAYFTLTARTLRTRAHATAVQVADAISREIQDRPILWRYDSLKLLAHIRAYTEEPSIARIEIADPDGARVRLDPEPIGDPAPGGLLLWESAPIKLNAQVVGHAWAGAVLDEARAGALLLLIPFGALGVGLAALIYFIPGRAMARAERRIAASQAALARFNQTLEQQVAERSLELRGAYDQLQAKEERLRELSSRAVLLQEAERRIIARELHDSAGQALTAIRINLQIIAQLAQPGTKDMSAETGLSPKLADKIAGLAGRTLTIADATLEEIRRAVSLLGPAILDDVGLVAAIQRLCDDFGERSDLRIDCELDLPARSGLSPALESVCYRVAQEALTNVARHAEATQVDVRLALHSHTVHLEIRDNGRGLDTAAPPRPRGATGGRGLVGMRERVELLGGTIQIEGRPGAGTRVIVDLPQVTLSEDGDDTAVVVA
jgi:signal transduction histidine kinase